MSKQETARKATALRPGESTLAEQVRALADAAGRESLAASIEENRVSLREVARAFGRYPSPLRSQNLGVQQRDILSLIRRLTSQNTFSIELVIPTRALVGRSMVMARLNFFRMLRHVVRQLELEAEEARELLKTVDDNVAECIYQKAAEEILTAIVCRSEGGSDVRERAASLLLQIWDAGPTTELYELLPVLAQTWRARRHARVAYGTMMGASEVFSLLAAGCDERFVDFLVCERCGENELWAFREFLFGLSYEDLEKLNREDPDQLVEVRDEPESEFNTREGIWLGTHRAGDAAENFYLFFLKRHLNATNRAMMQLPGPRQTAEQYVLEHLLRDHWEDIKKHVQDE